MSRWSLSFQDVSTPGAAIEIASTRVSAAIATERGGRTLVTAAATESLPEGVVVPGLTAANVKDRGAVRAALMRVLEKVGRPRRVGLVLPDPVAKVSLIRFQQIPTRAHELDQLIRFQVKKAAPFPIDDAQLSYVEGVRAADGIDFLVSAARREAIREYAAVCEDAGVHAGIVEIQTFNVVNAVLAAGRRSAADWLLVNVTPDWASVVVGRADDVILYRSRTAEADGPLLDLVHQTSMYYEDRLSGTGFERVLLNGIASASPARAGETEHLRSELADRLGTKVDVIDGGAAADFSEAVSVPDRAALTPLVGLLVRDKRLVA